MRVLSSTVSCFLALVELGGQIEGRITLDQLTRDTGPGHIKGGGGDGGGGGGVVKRQTPTDNSTLPGNSTSSSSMVMPQPIATQPRPSGPAEQWDQYATDSTKDKYRVRQLPGINFDHDVTYASSLKIGSSDPSDNRQLFFWYVPQRSTTTRWAKTLTVWVGGCGGRHSSAVNSFFHEHGPIYWRAGMDYPRFARHSWNNLTDVVYFECQTGVGYGAGRLPKSWDDIVTDLKNGLESFFLIFPLLRQYDLKLAGSGESAQVLAYLVDSIYNPKPTVSNTTTTITNSSLLSTDLQDDANPANVTQIHKAIVPPMPQLLKPTGMFVLSPWIDGGQSGEVTSRVNVENLRSLIGLETEDMAKLKQWDRICGTSAFANLYQRYPGKQMPTFTYSSKNWPCNYGLGRAVDQMLIFRYGSVAANSDDVSTNPQLTADPLYSSYSPPGKETRQAYFLRSDVLKALHVDPAGAAWGPDLSNESTDTVNKAPGDGHLMFSYPYGDSAAESGVLGRAIDALNKTFFVVGEYSANCGVEQLSFAMQNVTWGGKTGFDDGTWPGLVYGPTFVPPAEAQDTATVRPTIGGRWKRARTVTLGRIKRAGTEVARHQPIAVWVLMANFIDSTFTALDWKADGLESPYL